MRGMRILVTGAYGFIGSHIVAGLLAAGHAVVGCGRDVAWGRRRFPGIDWIACDFNRDLEAAVWRPRLAGIDAVVNCAGILQGSRGQSMDAIHRAAPIALFEACLAARVRRVIQISALGVEGDAGTAYALSKRAADAHLGALDLDWVVLRPSLVIAAGSYGGTSLLRGLAALPFAVPVPGDGGQRFQPVAMRDLVRAVCVLVEPKAPARMLLNIVGPEAMTLRDIVLGLRGWLGIAPAPVIGVPMALLRAAARLGDVFGYMSGRGTLRTTALRQLELGNTAEPEPFVAALGFAARPFHEALALEPSQVQDRWHARLYFLKPLLRITIGLFWLATGLITAFGGRQVELLLTVLGFTFAWAPFAVWGAALLDAFLGLALLARWRVRLIGSAQILVTIAYLILLSLAGPELWLAPLGPLTKTLPLIVATLVMIAIEDDR